MSETAPERDYLGLLVAGYVMAFVFPLGGFIAGIALAGRRTGHALAIVTISFLTSASVVFLFLWAALALP